jgi:hypothetical protein
MLLVQILCIGHVDINHPFQESNHLHRLISGAVIDNGKPKALLNRFGKRGYNLRGIVGRGDEVDVVATHPLESHHDLCHVRRGNWLTISKMADVVILAENAPKVAIG